MSEENPIDVPVITALLVLLLALWSELVSWWLVAVPAAFTVGYAVIVLLSTARSSGGETSGFGPAIPGWLLVSAPLACLGLVWLLTERAVSARSAGATVLIAVASVQFLASLRGGRAYTLLFDRRRVSWWALGWIAAGVGVLGSALVLANGSVFKMAFFFGFLLFALFLWFVVPMAAVQSRRTADAAAAESPYPSVSVIIPAYNEETCIGQCIESVLETTYPNDLLEIVVVDDGSTDDTYATASQYRDFGVEVYHKENGGKYSALNYGLFCSSGDIVVCVDADGCLASDALLNVVGAFQRDSNVGAVAGNVKVGNRTRHLTRLQALEYLVGINTYRRAFSWFGAVPVVPGCLSGFRREALERVDGYDPDTITEDFDVTLKILKDGWTVRQSDATVWTEAPFTLRDLYTQRRRWFTGSAETILKHCDVLIDGTSGNLHRVSYPFSLFRVFLAPLVLTPIYAVVVAALITRPYETALVILVLGFIVAFVYSLLVVRMDHDSPWIVLYAPLYVIGYKQFRECVLVLSLLGVLVFRSERTWGSVRRQGTLNTTILDTE
ncbi:hypothetical protein A6E15_00265 [Natrinema saccharevitans]|uniref:Glycosyltransferase 2-like domain-containing protein n=1 Tax=Natrinema saccharevitans TaxID=301967 RepID=A0A1S8AS54_9EURY|nr:hypothetical protein A6E15_00265 [Natrinema saccharevitans]